MLAWHVNMSLDAVGSMCLIFIFNIVIMQFFQATTDQENAHDIQADTNKQGGHRLTGNLTDSVMQQVGPEKYATTRQEQRNPPDNLNVKFVSRHGIKSINPFF